MSSTRAKSSKGHKGKRSAKNKASGYYVKRFQITEKNRKIKRLRHLKKHPNDQQTLTSIV